MGRHKDWERSLFAVVGVLSTQPFEWGKNDCVTFAADCVEAQTGVDMIADFRNKYRTERGARRAMIKAGSKDLGDLVALYLEETHVRKLARGDIVVCEGEGGDFCAVVMGATAVGPTPRGLRHCPIGQAKRAYKV